MTVPKPPRKYHIRESCEFEDLRGFNLWSLRSRSIRRQQVAVGPADPAAASGSRPCRPGGSKWQSALPTGGSGWVWALSRLPSYEEFGSLN